MITHLKTQSLKCKPYFSNKCAHGDFRIILIEKENIITNKNEAVQRETLLVKSHEIAKTLNNHFSETRKVKYILSGPLMKSMKTYIMKNVPL